MFFLSFRKSYLLVWSAESRLSYWQNFKKWKLTGHYTGVSTTLFSGKTDKLHSESLIWVRCSVIFLCLPFQTKMKSVCSQQTIWHPISQNTIPLLSQAVLSLISLYDSSLLECFKFINSYFCNTQNWLWQRSLGTWSYYCFNKKKYLLPQVLKNYNLA